MKKKKISSSAAQFISKIEENKSNAELYRAKKSYYGLFFNKTYAILLTIIILTVVNPTVAQTYLALIYNDLVIYSIITLSILIIIFVCFLAYFGRKLYNDLKSRLGNYVKTTEQYDKNNNTSGLNQHGNSKFDTEE